MYNEFLSAELIMSLICEDVDFDANIALIDKILLDEDDSPISLLPKDDHKSDVKRESDEIENDVLSTLDIDGLIDRLDAEEDSTPQERIYITIKERPQERLKLKVEPTDSDDDKAANEFSLILRDMTSRKSGDAIGVTVKDEERVDVKVRDDNIIHQPIKVHVDEPEQINVRVDDSAQDGDIRVKLNDSSDTGDIHVKVNDKNPAAASGDIHVKLVNVSKEPDNKIALYIKKRDELIATNDPNLQLSTCLKIIINLKKSLDKLANYVPDAKILMQVKSIIGEILDEIMNNSTTILRSPEQLKMIIYKIFDLITSVNREIEHQYTVLEDRIDRTTKKTENSEMGSSIKNAEIGEILRRLDEKVGNSKGQTKTPVINRKRI